MAKSEAVTGICLHQLIAREEAVIKRVIAFSSSQGRNYQLADLQNAQVVVVSDDTPVDFAALHPDGCMIARIASAGNAQPYDVLMTRPLLVTRVMRTLDEAVAVLQDNGAADVEVTAESAAPEVAADLASASEASDAEPGHSEASVPEEAAIQSDEPEQEKPAEQAVSRQESSIAAEPDTSAEQNDAVAQQESAEDQPIDAVAEPEPEAAQAASELAEPEAEAPAPEQSEEPAPEAAAADTDNDTQHKALVVDDSAAIRKQLELELRDAGISADFAEDGEQALEKIAANRYDLIFLDIIMPGIDGYEACRQMRLRPELKKTPIIMLSAKTSPLDEVQGVIAGASTYLTKPVKSEQLQNTLKRVSMWIDNFQAAS